MKTIAQQINWDFKTNGDLEIRDKKDNIIYWETSNGYWRKFEYDSQDSLIYWEDADGCGGDNRPKPCEDKVIEIEGVKYKLVKQ